MRFILISCYLVYYVSVSDSKNGTEKLPEADTNINNEPKSEPKSEKTQKERKGGKGSSILRQKEKFVHQEFKEL